MNEQIKSEIIKKSLGKVETMKLDIEGVIAYLGTDKDVSSSINTLAQIQDDAGDIVDLLCEIE